MECVAPRAALSPSEMNRILPMECVSLSVNLLSPHYGSLLNSFLHEARDLHLAAHPRNSPKTWNTTILLHPIFLQHLYKGRGRRWSSLLSHFSFDCKTVANLVLRAEPSCLPACILHMHLTLINLLLAYHFASR